jgi:hypothetical protein
VFITSSIADDVKTDIFDELLEIYQGELEKSLKSLGYDQHIPTLNEIQIDLLENGGICE